MRLARNAGLALAFLWGSAVTIVLALRTIPGPSPEFADDVALVQSHVQEGFDLRRIVASADSVILLVAERNAQPDYEVLEGVGSSTVSMGRLYDFYDDQILSSIRRVESFRDDYPRFHLGSLADDLRRLADVEYGNDESLSEATREVRQRIASLITREVVLAETAASNLSNLTLQLDSGRKRLAAQRTIALGYSACVALTTLLLMVFARAHERKPAHQGNASGGEV